MPQPSPPPCTLLAPPWPCGSGGAGRRAGAVGSCLYPGSPLPPAGRVRGRVLGRPPAARGLNGTPSPLPGEHLDGAVPMSLSPGERQTDREETWSGVRARAEPVGTRAIARQLVTGNGDGRGPRSISWARSGAVRGYVWVSPLRQFLGTFSLQRGSSSASPHIPSPPSPALYRDPASPQPQHPHDPTAGGRGRAAGRAARAWRHLPPGAAAAGWTPAACPCPSGFFAARWASYLPSSWRPRKHHTQPRC